jgi:ATP synthase F1 gamma subunit
MATIKKIREDIESNQELTGLVDILKEISAAKFRKAKDRKERFKTFLDSFESFFKIVNLSNLLHPFTVAGPGRMGIIMITSDHGFMGRLNAQVINAALDYRSDNPAELIILGQRGASFLKDIGEEFTFFTGIGEANRYQLVLELRDYVIRQRLNEKIGRAVMIYPEPASFVYQKIKLINIFPCAELFERNSEVDFRDERIIVESSLGKIVEYLAATWVTHKFYEVFEDSKLSEFAARTLSLENSHQQLLKRDTFLHRQYNYSLHRLIDRNMRDIFGSTFVRKRKADDGKK